MFHNSRPVPSQGALKVLYQLAYITSGAAAGAAALCVEERRRKIQFFQQIADRARRLRQSPRYYRAVLTLADGEHGDDGELGERARVAVQRRRKDFFGRKREHVEEVKAPELPSVVEQEYPAVRDSFDELAKTRWRPIARVTFQSSPLGGGVALRGPEMTRALVSTSTEAAPTSAEPKPADLRSGLETRDGADDRQQQTESIASPTANVSKGPLGVLVDLLGAPSLAGTLWSRRQQIGTLLEAGDQREISATIKNTYVKLVTGGDHRRATKLLVDLGLHRGYLQGYAKFADHAFSAALEHSDLDCCLLLLRLLSSQNCQKRKRVLECSAQFLKACDKAQSYEPVLHTFVKERTAIAVDTAALDGECQAILAFACTTDLHQMSTGQRNRPFTMFYRRTPEHLRGRLNTARTWTRLETIWETTHNFARVRTEYDYMHSWLQCVPDEARLRKLNRVMLRIQISAHRFEEALATVQQMTMNQPTSMHTVSLASLLLAKQNAWEPLDQLLRVAKKSGLIGFDSEAATIFNQMLALYTQRHTSDEAFNFVDRAMDEFGFKPNRATVSVMLESFVSHRTPDNIPKWLEHLEVRGYKFVLDSEAAAQLLSRYWQEQRPSYVLMMWYCRNLAHLRPSLAGPQLKDVVKKAIACEYGRMRGLTADNHYRRLHIISRLRRLEDAGDLVVPSPGYVVNTRIYATLRHRDESPKDREEDVGDEDAECQPKESRHATADWRAGGRRREPQPTKTAFQHDDSETLGDGMQALMRTSNSEVDIVSAYDRPRESGSALPASGTWAAQQMAAPIQAESESFYSTAASGQLQDGRNADPTSDAARRLRDSSTDAAPADDDATWADILTQTLDANEPGMRESILCASDNHQTVVVPLALGAVDLPDVDIPLNADTSLDVETAESIDDEWLSSSALDEERDPVASNSDQAATPAHFEFEQASPGIKKGPRLVEMRLALSFGHYERVRELYEASLDAANLPASLGMLVTAVIASLRQHQGDRQDAELLLSNARAAGMDVTGALSPVLVNQLRGLDLTDDKAVDRLRQAVFEHYTTIEKAGLPVYHHVGTNAASLLITSQRATAGIKLLDAIYRSKWASDRPFTTVTMTVYLNGYSRLRYLAGIRWTVDVVLRSRMRVDRTFCKVLKRISDHYLMDTASGSDTDTTALELMVDQCEARREEQEFDSKVAGRKLVKCIAECLPPPAHNNAFRYSGSSPMPEGEEDYPEAMREETLDA